MKQHTTPGTVNHCLRSAAFALLIAKKMPQFVERAERLDTELVIVSSILHDLGWATTKSLLSKDKRFEVDGANLARDFIARSSEKKDNWDMESRRMQITWDAIALHTFGSIAPYKEPEVALVHYGIHGDLLGPNLLGGGVISMEEFKEISHAFPRVGFANEFKETLCGLCRDKPETTLDNNLVNFGLKFGYDGKGTGKEEFRKLVGENHHAEALTAIMESIDNV